ncbi:hypothetical protein AYK24_05385 [Thermoplasmatales archaeon SG8-52-4]|nr:MAG: hypothetical protein AYK24_05385 [Thermoplasmatales archaeon SG8-52-4]
MKYKFEKVDFLLNKITNKDNLFRGNYTIEPYQNCEFGCLYCDSSYDQTINIKINAADILEKEIKKVKKGTIIVGSVNDAYQNAEKKYKITRELLRIIEKNNFPCHILTKTDLVLRDIDILRKINNCNVTLSLTSLNNSISKTFENKVPTTKIRLQAIKSFNKKGIKSGLAIIPIIPYLVEDELQEIVKCAKNYDAQYILHKYLELKGDQKSCFIDIINKYYPNISKKIQKLYEDSYMPKDDYIFNINNKMKSLCNFYNISDKI